MKKRLLPVLLIACFPITEARESAVTESLVKFTVRNAGISVNGTLSGIRCEISFDPENLGASNIYGTADPSTISTGMGIRDRHLRNSDYFDVIKFPEVRMRSKSFVKVSQDTFSAKFDLTIKNITKEVTVVFSRTFRQNEMHYKASFEINRLDFDLGGKSFLLDERVHVSMLMKEALSR